MRDRPRGEQTSVTDPSSHARGRSLVSVSWPIAEWAVAIIAAGAIALRVAGGVRYDALLVLAAGAAAIFLTFRFSSAKTAPAENHQDPDKELREIFDSAGPMLIAIGLDGCITHMNPAAERLLGYHAAELVGQPRTADILAPGEGPRVISELQRLSGIDSKRVMTVQERLAVLMNSVRALPPSQVPSFEAQFRRKDGTLLPVTLHISALRKRSG